MCPAHIWMTCFVVLMVLLTFFSFSFCVCVFVIEKMVVAAAVIVTIYSRKVVYLHDVGLFGLQSFCKILLA